mgnify:CR=1 FL=1
MIDEVAVEKERDLILTVAQRNGSIVLVMHGNNMLVLLDKV